VAGARYGEVMTILILLGGIVAAIATIVGYVVRRDRRGRASFVDPSVSRDALVETNRQAVQGRLAEAGMVVTDFLGSRPGSHSRADRR
jgi:hypothetical protein